MYQSVHHAIVGLPAIVLACLVSGSSLASDEDQKALAVRYAAQHWVGLTDSRTIEGSVSYFKPDGELVPMTNAQVVLMPLDESTGITCCKTDQNGRFVFPNGHVGVYGLVAFGSEGLASHTVHVLDSIVAENSGKPLATQLAITTASSDRDFSMRMVRGYGNVEHQVAKGPIRTPQYRLASHELMPRPKAITQAIELSADGTLHGRLTLPSLRSGVAADLSSMNVSIIQNKQVVERTVTDKQGRFEVKSLKPGAYGVMASGTAGFASFGLQLLPSSRTATNQQADRKFQLASTQVPVHVHELPTPEYSEVVCEVCPPAIVEVIDSCMQPETIVESENGCGCCQGEEVIIDEGIVTEEGMMTDPYGNGYGMGGYGGYGSGYGGGGGGGGGGGFGGLGGLAGLAGIGAAIAAGNNNDGGTGNVGGIIIASPASP